MVRTLAFHTSRLLANAKTAKDRGSNPLWRTLGFNMPRARGKKPSWIKQLAEKRIETLLGLAKRNARKHPERSRRYVELTGKLSMKYNITISREWKKRFCKKCNAFWILGKNLKVRSDPRTKTMNYNCLECGFVKRYGYAKKSKKTKQK